MIFKFGITQTDREFNLSDLCILDTPLKITGKSNIFADIKNAMIANKLTNKLEISLEQIYNEKTHSTYVIGIQVRPMKVLHGTSNNICSCQSCFDFMCLSKRQENKYNEDYIELIIVPQLRKEQEAYEKINKTNKTSANTIAKNNKTSANTIMKNNKTDEDCILADLDDESDEDEDSD